MTGEEYLVFDEVRREALEQQRTSNERLQQRLDELAP